MSRTRSGGCRGENRAVAEARPGRDGVLLQVQRRRLSAQAAFGTATFHWNGRPVIHIRCRITASLRAIAIVAFLLPAARGQGLAF